MKNLINKLFRHKSWVDRELMRIERNKAAHQKTSDLERGVFIRKANELARSIGVETVDERVSRKLAK